MQISGFSSLSEYYAYLRQLQSQQNAQSSSAAEALAGASGETSAQSGGFAAALSQAAGVDSQVAETSGTEAVATAPPRQAPPPQGGGQVADSEDEETVYSALVGDTDGDGKLSAEELAALEEGEETARPDQPPRNPSLGNMFRQDWSSSLTYGDLLEGGASSLGSFSRTSEYMQNMIRGAYGA